MLRTLRSLALSRRLTVRQSPRSDALRSALAIGSPVSSRRDEKSGRLNTNHMILRTLVKTRTSQTKNVRENWMQDTFCNLPFRGAYVGVSLPADVPIGSWWKWEEGPRPRLHCLLRRPLNCMIWVVQLTYMNNVSSFNIMSLVSTTLKWILTIKRCC